MAKKNIIRVDLAGEIAIEQPLYLLKKPFTMLVTGASQSGKTNEVLSWLASPEKIFEKTFDKITYVCGSTHQKAFENPLLKHVTFTENLDIIHSLSKTENGQLLILDDVLEILANDVQLSKIVTQECHHLDVSIIFLTQTVFYNSNVFKIVKENTNYFFIKNHSNPFKLKVFANQIGLDPRFFMSAYNHVMNQYRFGGILIDLHIKSDLKSLSRLRYALITGPKILVSDEDFTRNIENGCLKKTAEKKYKYIPPVFND